MTTDFLDDPMNPTLPGPTYERIRRTSVPVRLQGDAGQLVQWLKKPGEPVEKYEPLAIIRTADGVETEVTAALPGVVKLLMFHPGTEVASGATLCYVQPEGARPVAPVSPPRSAPPARTLPAGTAPEASQAPAGREMPESGPTPVKTPKTAPAAFQGRPGPQETAGAGALSGEAVSPAPIPAPDAPPPRGKTTHKTYHIEQSQVARVKRLALELQLTEPDSLDCNESELVRAAIELLLGLPRPALLATLGVNRQREKQGRYGSGWPRPGKP